MQSLNKGDVKIDHQLTGKDHLMGRYSIADNQESDPNPYPAIGAFPLQSRGQNALIALTHIFTPHWINEARVSYYRSYFNFSGALQGMDINSQAGIQGFAGIPYPGFPQIAISGYSNFTGSPSDSRPKQNRIRTWQYSDSVSYATGKHNVKFGYELRHNTNTFISGSTSMGTFTFLGTYTGVRTDAEDDSPVIASRKGGGHLDRSQVLRVVQQAARRARIRRKVSPHWFRHAHASHAMDRGAGIHLVAATLSHSSIAITGRYLHVKPTESSAKFLAV